MPRATQSQAGRIVEFFRSASLEVAEFAGSQVNEILRDRRAKSKAAKERAQGPPAAAAPAAKIKVKRAKKSHKKKSTRPASVPGSEPGLPLETVDQEAGDLAGVGSER